MAGIYLHIPFCKQKCSYCDFYSNTHLGKADELIDSEIAELKMRRDYLNNEQVGTIYFGGGTPSVLKLNQVESLLNAVNCNYNVLNDCEITFECNPDDVTIEYLIGLKQLGINRISIGVQSFDDKVLEFLRRRHSAAKAELVIHQAKDAGFDNISIDLMFGIPGISFDNYKEALLKGINLGIQHLSVYQLTFEENTLLYKKLIHNEIKEISDDESVEQFDYTIEKLKEFEFGQYEVSNYAKEGFISRHNWLYWSNGNYLGIGPSAHSYNGHSRQWNTANNNLYVKGIKLNDGYFEREILTEIDKFNEYILTGLRTFKGVNSDYVRNTFNHKIWDHFIKIINSLVNDGFMNHLGNSYSLRKNGIFILDFLVKKLYYI
jgi:oxygen-independent coproporphyrinogen III oxidase